jgi:hypothetical protein
MGLRCRRVRKDGRLVSYWLVREQELPADAGDFPEFDRFITEMEKRFPPPKPLDDDEELEPE